MTGCWISGTFSNPSPLILGKSSASVSSVVTAPLSTLATVGV